MPGMKVKKISILSIFMVTVLPLGSVAWGQKKVSYDGYVSSGLEYLHRKVYGEGYYKGKLKFEIDLSKDLRGVLDFRGKSADREIELKGAYVRFSYVPHLRVKVGQIKKRFGLEELIAKEKLSTIQESLINRYLAPFGYVVRGLGIELSRVYKKKNPYSFNLGIFYNESHQSFLLGRVARYNLWGFYQIGVDGIYRRCIDGGNRDFYAFSLDLTRQVKAFHWEGEVFYGQDPVESDYRRLCNKDEEVSFLGVRSLVLHHWDTHRHVIQGVEPLFLFSFLAPDVDTMKTHRFQFLVGLNLYFHPKVRFRINGDLILTNTQYNPDEYAMTQSRAIGELQLRW